jgi:metallopeptidase MepB
MMSPRGHRYAKSRHSVCHYPGSLSLYISGFCFAELIWKSLFEGDPMSKEAGMRWRREVLEKGGTMKPLDMLENILGVGILVT